LFGKKTCPAPNKMKSSDAIKLIASIVPGRPALAEAIAVDVARMRACPCAIAFCAACNSLDTLAVDAVTSAPSNDAASATDDLTDAELACLEAPNARYQGRLAK
jgi:hypothetical protein